MHNNIILIIFGPRATVETLNGNQLDTYMMAILYITAFHLIQIRNTHQIWVYWKSKILSSLESVRVISWFKKKIH